MSNDLSNIRPIPVQKTLLIINNFVLTTTTFLNSFTETCERKISSVSSKVSELEILLSVLEAKLDSIPFLDDESVPVARTTAPAAEATGAPSVPVAAAESTPVEAAPEPAAEEANSDMVLPKDHPDYSPFVKLLKVGVPLPVVQGKLSSSGKGLDPTVLERLEEMISLSAPPVTALTTTGDAEDGEGGGDLD